MINPERCTQNPILLSLKINALQNLVLLSLRSDNPFLQLMRFNFIQIDEMECEC